MKTKAPRNHVHLAMLKSKRCSVHEKTEKAKRSKNKVLLKKGSSEPYFISNVLSNLKSSSLSMNIKFTILSIPNIAYKLSNSRLSAL